MMNLNKHIHNAATEVVSIVNDIYEDEKIKSDARKKMHMLDTWHRVMSKKISICNGEYDKCVFRTYYNSFTNRHTKELTVDECYNFILALGLHMKRCYEGSWNEQS